MVSFYLNDFVGQFAAQFSKKFGVLQQLGIQPDADASFQEISWCQDLGGPAWQVQVARRGPSHRNTTLCHLQKWRIIFNDTQEDSRINTLGNVFGILWQILRRCGFKVSVLSMNCGALATSLLTPFQYPSQFPSQGAFCQYRPVVCRSSLGEFAMTFLQPAVSAESLLQQDCAMKFMTLKRPSLFF